MRPLPLPSLRAAPSVTRAGSLVPVSNRYYACIDRVAQRKNALLQCASHRVKKTSNGNSPDGASTVSDGTGIDDSPGRLLVRIDKAAVVRRPLRPMVRSGRLTICDQRSVRVNRTVRKRPTIGVLSSHGLRPTPSIPRQLPSRSCVVRGERRSGMSCAPPDIGCRIASARGPVAANSAQSAPRGPQNALTPGEALFYVIIS